jgi:hypothetical protein
MNNQLTQQWIVILTGTLSQSSENQNIKSLLLKDIVEILCHAKRKGFNHL